MNADIEVEQDGPVLRVTLNRPTHGNVVTNDMTTTLTRLLDGAAENANFVVLRANGAVFCEGWGDLSKLPAPGTVEAYERLKTYDLVFNCYSAFRRARVPVVGVVQGAARGFGCAIAALCDITLASESATFQVPELAHRVLPTMVMSALFDRVPLKALNYLVATAAEIDARQALAYGIVSAVVAPSTLEAAAADLCARLARAPRPALLGLKEYAGSASRMDAQGAINFARNLHATVNTSSEMRKPE